MEPVKLGVLGVSGHYSLRLRIPLRNSRIIDLHAIGSRSVERSEKAAVEWGFRKAYGSYQAVLDDPDVEVVYIPLPNHMHTEWIKKCADAGKAVICEKPIALNAGDAAEALEYAEKKGVIVMESFMYRFHPQWLRAKELISVGEIGRIQSIQTIFSYNLQDKSNIRNISEMGGGGLYDIGCYAISSARFLSGKEPMKAVSLIKRDNSDKTDILTSALLDFGSFSSMFTVGTRMAPQQQVTVYGTKGLLKVLIPFNAFPDVPMKIIVNNGVKERKINFEPVDQYSLMFESFAEVYRKGGSVPIPPEDAVNNMKVIDAVFRSEKSGGWENIEV